MRRITNVMQGCFKLEHLPGISFTLTQSIGEISAYLIFMKISPHLIIWGYSCAPKRIKERIFEIAAIQHQGTLQPVQQIDRVSNLQKMLIDLSCSDIR